MQEDALSTQVAICAITGWQRQSTTAVDWDGTWKGRHETVTAPVNICLRALNVRRHKVGRKCSTLVRISDWMMRRWFKMRHHGSDVMQVTSSDWVLLSFQLANTKRRLHQLHLVANSLPGNRVIGQHLSSSCRGWVWGLTSPDNAGWPVGSMLTISVKTSWRQQEGRYLGRYLVTNWQWCCYCWVTLVMAGHSELSRLACTVFLSQSGYLDGRPTKERDVMSGLWSSSLALLPVVGGEHEECGCGSRITCKVPEAISMVSASIDALAWYAGIHTLNKLLHS